MSSGPRGIPKPTLHTQSQASLVAFTGEDPRVLASSLPPRLRGEPLNPAAATSLQLQTLASWRLLGFSPISLHSTAELAANPCHAATLTQAGVDTIVVHQSGPDPLPNLKASLQALTESYPDGVLAITNADILFAPGSALASALEGLRPDQALIGRRTNLAAEAPDGSGPAGERDPYGFDFFAVHAGGLRRALPLIPESLVFGRPWWDLFLPLALLASGLQLVDPGPDLFQHSYHEERWSAEQWYRHGQLADQRFLELLRQQGHQHFARRWLRQRNRYIRRWPGLTGLRHRLRVQRRSLLAEQKLLPLHLSDVSDAINDWVDRELRTSAPA